MLRQIRVGQQWPTNKCGTVTVVDVQDWKNITVKFTDGTSTVVTSSKLKRGQVINKNLATLCEQGFIGYGSYLPKTHLSLYNAWVRMFKSCKDSLGKSSIDSTWFNFQVFAADYEQLPGYWSSTPMVLSNKILSKECLIYSKDTCVLVPVVILNHVCADSKKSRGSLPMGVSPIPKVNSSSRNLFRAHCSINNKLTHLGCFETFELAFVAYKKAKEGEIKRLANVYRRQLDPRAYYALINYEIHIND